MSALSFVERGRCARVGLKGPRAAQWLLEQGIELPESANSWRSVRGGAGAPAELLVARLGTAEFFLEEDSAGRRVRALESSMAAAPPGVYPVLREDAAFFLSGDASDDVLAQVCNIDFARAPAGSSSVIMTMMIGVAVLVVPDEIDGGRRYRIWCDPSFGAYLASTVGTVVMENGGNVTGVSI